MVLTLPYQSFKQNLNDKMGLCDNKQKCYVCPSKLHVKLNKKGPMKVLKIKLFQDDYNTVIILTKENCFL